MARKRTSNKVTKKKPAAKKKATSMKKGGSASKSRSAKASMRCGETRKSTRPGKKIMYLNCEGGKKKLIHAGAKGYSDFTKHKDPKRRANFKARHNCKTAKKGTSRWLACTKLL